MVKMGGVEQTLIQMVQMEEAVEWQEEGVVLAAL